jgi:hypothetical protein
MFRNSRINAMHLVFLICMIILHEQETMRRKRKEKKVREQQMQWSYLAPN